MRMTVASKATPDTRARKGARRAAKGAERARAEYVGPADEEAEREPDQEGDRRRPEAQQDGREQQVERARPDQPRDRRRVADEPLSRFGFWADWTVTPRWAPAY